MKKIFTLALAAMGCLAVSAQNLTIKGVLEKNKYDDGDQWKTTMIGSLYDEKGNYTGTTAYIVDQGIYSMTWDGTTLSTPAKSPAVNLSEIKQGTQVDYDKAVWANNFNLMFGNSGAVYVDGILTTVMSRDYQSTEDEELFAVRKWNASSGNLLSGKNEYYNVNRNLESAGMCYNPIDDKVYGLFYISAASLPKEITEDPEYYTDEDDADFDREGQDAGYCICTIDLKTMTVTPITPGLYYKNFVTFAINSEGRAFALTSGGSNGVINSDGKMEDMNGNLVGAELCEFDLRTGLMKTNAVKKVDSETNEEYTVHENIYKQGMGYCSQYKRQSACFGKSNPYKMYWNGYYNSGKGINEWGSWSTLSDKEWRTNGKFDTCLYEVDILNGTCKRLAKIGNRCTFSCMWVDGDDASDGCGFAAGVESVKSQNIAKTQIYNLSGQQLNGQKRGLNIVKSGADVRKVLVK